MPLWEGKTAACVEAIWQGLKVFESADVDEAALANDTMRDTGEQLTYVEARRLIYLPTYR